MPRPTDELLRMCASCTRHDLALIAETVLHIIEQDDAAGDAASAEMYRDMSRVIDGIGELRFNGWSSLSPARKRDAALLSMPLGGLREYVAARGDGWQRTT